MLGCGACLVVGGLIVNFVGLWERSRCEACWLVGVLCCRFLFHSLPLIVSKPCFIRYLHSGDGVPVCNDGSAACYSCLHKKQRANWKPFCGATCYAAGTSDAADAAFFALCPPPPPSDPADAALSPRDLPPPPPLPPAASLSAFEQLD